MFRAHTLIFTRGCALGGLLFVLQTTNITFYVLKGIRLTRSPQPQQNHRVYIQILV
jgi:hypothetical protein